MNSKPTTEHFCTLFDSHYLPLGIALHQSLMTHAKSFHLWVLCIDEEVELSLQKLDLPYVSLMPLREMETAELLAVKPNRTRGEYCWTLTPFIFQAVFDQDPNIEQVTYLDADLFFFDDPAILLNEFMADKHVLFTEHAYAPEYDQTATSGKFCVQFLTVRCTDRALKVIYWWQKKCLQWCFNRIEDGKFGDQKYLESWPTLFGDDVQIVENIEKTLAPWNIAYFERTLPELSPVFYHFHGLKIISEKQAQLYFRYRINSKGMDLYCHYIQALAIAKTRLEALNIRWRYFPLPKDKMATLRRWKWLIFKEVRFRKIETI